MILGYLELELKHLVVTAGSDYDEFDLTYKTKVGENTTLFAAYVYQDYEELADENNFIRFWARYNF
jgi:hypothetical protein